MAAERGNRKPDSGRRRARTGRPADADPKALGPEGAPLAGLSELARRALALGFSGFFLTEETIRRALGDTLPRDWIDFAVDQSDRTRAEFVERLARELASVFESMDLEGMAERFLEDRTIEVKAEIRVKPRAKPGAGGKQAGDRRGARLDLSVLPEVRKR